MKNEGTQDKYEDVTPKFVQNLRIFVFLMNCHPRTSIVKKKKKKQVP